MGATPSCTHKISPRTHRLQTQPCTRLLGAGPRAMSIWPQPSSKLRGAAATFLPMTIALARSDEHAAVDVLDPTLAAKRHGDLEVGEDAFDDLLNSLLPAQMPESNKTVNPDSLTFCDSPIFSSASSDGMAPLTWRPPWLLTMMPSAFASMALWASS